MANQMRQAVEKAIEEEKNQEITFKRAPKRLIDQTVEKVLKKHHDTIKELADR